MLLAVALALTGLSHATNAKAAPDPVELSVVNRDNGQTLKVWRHHGRLFVAGDVGARYGLRVSNHTDGRVLVVMSVDGVNILTGETAGYGQRGYVFNPYQSYDVNGWRKSNTEIADFTFAPLPRSYAARTGRPSDVGVIGIAVFKERVVAPVPIVAAPEKGRAQWAGPPPPAVPAPQPPPIQPHIAPPAPINIAPPQSVFIAPVPPAPLAPAPASVLDRSASTPALKSQDEKLGTAHGAREWSTATTVPFVRATPNPEIVKQIEYDTRDHLVASGVIPPSDDPNHRSRPFPSNPDGSGYVPDPPG
jgi:hypothetical protein